MSEYNSQANSGGPTNSWKRLREEGEIHSGRENMTMGRGRRWKDTQTHTHTQNKKESKAIVTKEKEQKVVVNGN